MSLKVLILGASGYLGGELAEILSLQHEVYCLVRSEAAFQKANLKAPLSKIIYDHEVDKHFFDFALNLVVDYGRSGNSDLENTNVNYPYQILAKANVRTVINFSTALPSEVSEYARTKKILELKLESLCLEKNIQLLNLHLQHFYGPSAPESNFITYLIKKLVTGETLELTDGEQKRDFLYVDDVIASIQLLLEKSKTLKPCEIIEIGSGEAIRVRELVELIAKLSHSKSKLNFGSIPRRKSEPDELVADTSRLKEIGWCPQINLHQGINSCIKFHLDI